MTTTLQTEQEQYHLQELEIARSPNDPRRVMPDLPAGARRVLDVGCGAGQTLLALDLKPGVMACGIDMDGAALALGRRWTDRIHFVQASGERLPFDDESFDAVISRVALPYMDIPVAVAEAFRILKPGGVAWFSLHSSRMVWEMCREVLQRGQVKRIVHLAYVMLNGLSFHLTGRLFDYPIKRGGRESFQSRRGMVRALRRTGFHHVQIEQGRFFIVTAQK